MIEEHLSYPGYRWAYGSTSGWFREPGGPYVAYTYSPPDKEGMSIRREMFFDRSTDAAVWCGALRWEDYADEAGWG